MKTKYAQLVLETCMTSHLLKLPGKFCQNRAADPFLLQPTAQQRSSYSPPFNARSLCHQPHGKKYIHYILLLRHQSSAVISPQMCFDTAQRGRNSGGLAGLGRKQAANKTHVKLQCDCSGEKSSRKGGLGGTALLNRVQL